MSENQIDHERIHSICIKVQDLFVDMDVKFRECPYVCMLMIAQVCMDSQMPHEKFMQLITEVAQDFEQEWPIG